MYTTRNSSFFWLGVAISKADLMDLIFITERFAHCKKNRLCKFNVPGKKDEPGKLPRLNAYCSYRAKPLKGSPDGLNHLAKL